MAARSDGAEPALCAALIAGSRTLPFACCNLGVHWPAIIDAHPKDGAMGARTDASLQLKGGQNNWTNRHNVLPDRAVIIAFNRALGPVRHRDRAMPVRGEADRDRAKMRRPAGVVLGVPNR